MLNHEFVSPVNGSQCHASTLVALTGGRFMAAWFEGRAEGDPTCAIRFACRGNDGRWTAPETIAKVAYAAHWNPVLFHAPDGTLTLCFKVGAAIAQWRTYVMRSSDEGGQWSAPVELVPGDDSGGRGPVKNPPICTAAGLLVAPASYEVGGRWRAFTDMSDDGGMTWHRSADVPLPEVHVDDPALEGRLGVIQPTLWESSPERLHMLLRSNNHCIYRSDSEDGGRTWGVAYPTNLPNNNSGICLARLGDGRLLLAANLQACNWGGRGLLSLIVSRDNGIHWGAPVTVEAAPSDGLPSGQAPELSYPTLVALPDGDAFALTYTWHRRRIAFVAGSFARCFGG